MLGVFSGTIVDPPEELVVAGSRTPSSKTKASVLFDQFLEKNSPAVHIKIGHNEAILAYTHYNQSILNPRYIYKYVKALMIYIYFPLELKLVNI